MRHQYIGSASYTKTLTLPTPFVAHGGSTWLIVERVERSVEVYSGATLLKRHTGYLSPCEVELADVKDGTLNITLVVNSTRNVGYDGLVGEQDLITDGTNLGGWGGIGGHVTLERRGGAWIMDPHTQTEMSSSFDSATVMTTVVLGGGVRSGAIMLRQSYINTAGKLIAQNSVLCNSTLCGADSKVTVSGVQLWSPQSPTLYTAHLELIVDGSTIDEAEVSFGFRRLDVIGYHWKFNGKWLYLHGYGDDSIYPHTVGASSPLPNTCLCIALTHVLAAPPLNKTYYKWRLGFARSLGFNFVRHHSHVLPNEYFEAACEVGMLVSAEFPLAYGGAKAECPGVSCDQMLEHEWNSTVRHIRSYPCVPNPNLSFTKQIPSLYLTLTVDAPRVRIS